MRLLRDERGETLVEIMMTIVFISVAMVAVVAMMGTSIRASDAHRSMARAEAVLRSYGEAVKLKQARATSYTVCPTAADLTPTTFSSPGWSARIVPESVQYWIPAESTFPNGTWTGDRGACTTHYASCTRLGPSCGGLERVTIEVTGPTSRSDYARHTATARIAIRRYKA